MIAGEVYWSMSPELLAERDEAKNLTKLYNDASKNDDRLSILPKILGAVGEESYIEPSFHCTYGKNTFLGKNVYLNFSCVIIDNNFVRIGNNTMLGPAVQIYTAEHPLEAEPRIQLLETAKEVNIGMNVWIAGGVIILPGVTIGDNAVVGAGAVVTRDVEPNTVVVGNPAKVIRKK